MGSLLLCATVVIFISIIDRMSNRVSANTLPGFEIVSRRSNRPAIFQPTTLGNIATSDLNSLILIFEFDDVLVNEITGPIPEAVEFVSNIIRFTEQKHIRRYIYGLTTLTRKNKQLIEQKRDSFTAAVNAQLGARDGEIIDAYVRRTSHDLSPLQLYAAILHMHQQEFISCPLLFFASPDLVNIMLLSAGTFLRRLATGLRPYYLKIFSVDPNDRPDIYKQKWINAFQDYSRELALYRPTVVPAAAAAAAAATAPAAAAAPVPVIIPPPPAPISLSGPIGPKITRTNELSPLVSTIQLTPRSYGGKRSKRYTKKNRR